MKKLKVFFIFLFATLSFIYAPIEGIAEPIDDINRPNNEIESAKTNDEDMLKMVLPGDTSIDPNMLIPGSPDIDPKIYIKITSKKQTPSNSLKEEPLNR